MNLHRLNEYVMSTIVITIGLVVAVACGKLTATGEQKLLATLLVGVTCVAVALALRNKIWILIPLGWQLGGAFPALPVPFRLVDFIVAYVAVTALVLIALRVYRVRATPLETVDFVIFIILALLLFAFIRNPVGVQAFGSSMVGGRPYFNTFIGVLAYLILRSAPVSLRESRSIPFYLLIGAALVSFCTAVGYLLPSVGGTLAQFYTGFMPPELPGVAATGDGMNRAGGLSVVGETGMLFLNSYCTPITLFLPVFPFRCLSAGVFSVANLLSGFRTSIATSFAYVIMSSWFRRRFRDMAIIVAVGTVIIGFLSLGIIPLPLSAQRALSFLPGAWRNEAVQDANDSTQWRIDMWRMVLTEDKWIRNKWFGDGFGFSAYDLSLMQAAEDGGSGIAGGSAQEGFMIVGAYHSGPLSAIRFVGYIGLAVFYWLLIILAIKANRLIGRTRGTCLFPVALFLGMPAILKPVYFILVFGAFDGDLPTALFTAGMIRLLERAVDDYQSASGKDRENATPVETMGQPKFRRQFTRPSPALVNR